MTTETTTSQATLHTSLGDIIIELFPNHTPKTVANFAELATGAREWTDPRNGEKSTANLYDNTVFHRIIEGFMIQGGDPLGRGTGGPGYKFADGSMVNWSLTVHTFWLWPTQVLEPMVRSSLLL